MSVAAPSQETLASTQASTKSGAFASEMGSEAITPELIKREIGRNWGWIMAAGVIGVLGGTAALMAPVLATGVTVTFIASLLAVVGFFHLAGTFFVEKGLKLESFLTGTVQVLLAAVMVFYPFASLMSITLLLAGFIMADGVVRVAMALRNRTAPGWGWTLAGGVAGIATSLIVLTALPTSALWVIGVLVGVSLLCNGATRIAIALQARELNQAAE